jgi:hypothetical protein
VTCRQYARTLDPEGRHRHPECAEPADDDHGAAKKNNGQRKRKPDPIFDAIVTATSTDPASMTKSARGALNKAAKELRDVGATPEDVARRARRYRERFPRAACTSSALVKHWPTLDHDVERPPIPDEMSRWRRPEFGPYVCPLGLGCSSGWKPELNDRGEAVRCECITHKGARAEAEAVP